MTTPTIERRAWRAAEDLQQQARTVSRDRRPTVADLESAVRVRRFATAGATLAVALVATVGWMQATTPDAPPPVVSEGSGDPTVQATAEPSHPEAEPVDYGQGQILARPSHGDTAQAVSAEPETGTCIGPARVLDLVTLVVGPDAEIVGPDAATGCLMVSGQQRMRIAAHDGTYQSFTVEFAGWQLQLDPGEAVVLDAPVADYLEHGVHDVDSDFEPAQATVWFTPRADGSTATRNTH